MNDEDFSVNVYFFKINPAIYIRRTTTFPVCQFHGEAYYSFNKIKPNIRVKSMGYQRGLLMGIGG